MLGAGLETIFLQMTFRIDRGTEAWALAARTTEATQKEIQASPDVADLGDAHKRIEPLTRWNEALTRPGAT
jgi:hypothetical protein